MDTLFMNEEDWWAHETGEDDRCATPMEACREYARNVGAERPDTKWILTDYDTWESNPFYRGPACLGSIHPEDNEIDEVFWAFHADCKGGPCKHGFGDPVYGPRYDSLLAGKEDGDDGIPF